MWEASPKNTLLHLMDVRVKLALMAAMMAVTVLLDSPQTLFLLFCCSLGLHGLARSSFAQWRIVMLFVLLGIWGSMTSQALFYNRDPRTLIACLLPPSVPVIGTLTGGVYVYREGLEYGAVQALRSAIMMSLGLMVSWTSDPRQILRSFLAWKMPYAMAFMLITGLRFLPVVFQETAIVLTAQRLRGFQPLRSFSPRRMIQTAFQTLFPILARTIRRAATLAASVESRGFDQSVRLTGVRRWRAGEWLLCGLMATTVIAVVLLKTVDALQFNGIIYLPSWRGIYDGMKVWL